MIQRIRADEAVRIAPYHMVVRAEEVDALENMMALMAEALRRWRGTHTGGCCKLGCKTCLEDGNEPSRCSKCKESDDLIAVYDAEKAGLL